MSLIFPSDLGSRYYLSIDFKAYRRSSPLDTTVSFVESSMVSSTRNSTLGASSRTGSDSIKLPLPATLVDSQSLNWSVESMNDVAEMVMAEKAGFNIGNIAQASVKGLSAAAATTGGLGAGVLKGLSTAAQQQAGLAMNPLLTVLFKHPEFKTHQFSWTFSPNSVEESETLKDIIETLRMASLPNNYGSIYGYPDMALIRYSNEEQMYKFQPAVITNVTTNYAPMGAPSFFAESKAPNMVTITMSFLEIILNTRESYGSTDKAKFLGGASSTSTTTSKSRSQIN